MMVYHGTKNAKNFNIDSGYMSSNKKGKHQGGCGLYTIDNYYDACKYGKVIGLELELFEDERSSNVYISKEKIFDFASGVLSKKSLSIFQRLYEKEESINAKAEKEINADLFQNMMILINEDKFHLIAQEVNNFMVENKAKYTVSLYSGNRMILVHDFAIIKRKLDPLLISETDVHFVYDLRSEKIEEKLEAEDLQSKLANETKNKPRRLRM